MNIKINIRQHRKVHINIVHKLNTHITFWNERQHKSHLRLHNDKSNERQHRTTA